MTSSRVAFSFVLIALCCHGYGAAPAVESTTEGKPAATTTAGKSESKSGGISVRFGAYETNDDDLLTFPGITNRAFGSFGSSSSSSPSSPGVPSASSASSSSSSSSSTKKVGVEGPQQLVRPDRPGRLQQVSSSSPCVSCCNSRPCGGSFPPTGGPFIPDQAFYLPPRPPQFIGGPEAFYPPSVSNPYPGPVHGGPGVYSNSHAASSSSSGFNKFGNGYPQGNNHINPGYQGGGYGQNHIGGGGNIFYPERPVVGGGSSSSSQANSYSNSGSYSGNAGYPNGGGPGFSHQFPGGYPGSHSGSFSSSSASSSSNKGGSFSSSASQSGSFSGNVRPVRPVVPNTPATRPEVTPEFSLPDGMCRSSSC